jgi:hypothetical protein
MAEADYLSPIDLPDERGKRAHELLASAVALADQLLAMEPGL